MISFRKQEGEKEKGVGPCQEVETPAGFFRKGRNKTPSKREIKDDTFQGGEEVSANAAGPYN